MTAPARHRICKRCANDTLASPMYVWPCSSTNIPRRVSSFIMRVMISCNTACSASSVGACASTKTGSPSTPRRYTPSSTTRGAPPAARASPAWVVRPASQAQQDRQRQHPLAHRYMGDDAVDQVGRRLRHAPGAARRAEAAALATQGDELVVAAVAAAQSQEAVGQDGAFEEGIELVLGRSAAGRLRRRPRPGRRRSRRAASPADRLGKPVNDPPDGPVRSVSPAHGVPPWTANTSIADSTGGSGQPEGTTNGV